MFGYEEHPYAFYIMAGMHILGLLLNSLSLSSSDKYRGTLTYKQSHKNLLEHANTLSNVVFSILWSDDHLYHVGIDQGNKYDVLT